MNQYIGTKIIQAEPARRLHFKNGAKVVVGMNEHLCPTIERLAVGCEIGYRVWYSDGYESFSPGDVFEESYRRTDGMNFSYYEPSGICGEACHADIGSAALVFVDTRGRQVGWLASQADMLADDWYIVE